MVTVVLIEGLQLKICRSTWVQDGARVVILRQGCAKSVVGVQDPYSQLCRTTACVPYYIHHPDTNFCPIGPQASCCCNEPMCNMNVKPYNRPCRVPPLPKNNTIKYGRPVKSSSNFTTLLFIVLGCVAVGALCFWGCLFGFVMGSSRCISISCPNLKLNKDRTTTTPNITTNAPVKTEIV
ncbi:uncharacterized protein LOC143465993 isoform X2 [Clavelina lepadiformis]|uniref:uncharacterized protein LOC143465993 isoform X2 n=1 Tax=Clavelina lepadiformis TaxID=159417 RepID=UPI0040422202